MDENIFVAVLKTEEEKRKAQAALKMEWGMAQRKRLCNILEKEGATITNWMWDALLFNINGLRISQNGKVCYLSFYKPSKRILDLFARYNNVIKDNFNYITKS